MKIFCILTVEATQVYAFAKTHRTVCSVYMNLPANAGDVRDLWFNPWVGKTPWRRAWQATQVFLPKKSYGQRSLAGYSPKGHKELDTTEHAHNTADHTTVLVKSCPTHSGGGLTSHGAPTVANSWPRDPRPAHCTPI